MHFFQFQNNLALTSKDKEVSRSPILPLQNKGERYLNRPTTSARFRNSQRLIDLQINSETKTARYFRPLSRHLSIYESYNFFILSFSTQHSFLMEALMDLL